MSQHEKIEIEFFDRVTWVESMLACPHKATSIPWKSDVDYIINTTIWDIWHLAHRHPDLAEVMAKKFFGETMIKLTWQRDNIGYDMITQVIDMAREWIKWNEEKWMISYWEAKSQYIKSKTLITWGYDELLLNPFDWTIHLNDFKIVKNVVWYYAVQEAWLDGVITLKINPERKQIRHYSNFVFDDFPDINEIVFSYVCYRKLKTVERVIVSQKVSREEARAQVDADIEEYEAYKINDFYPCKKNAFCYSCPLFKADKAKALWLVQCPLYTYTPEISWIEIF